MPSPVCAYSCDVTQAFDGIAGSNKNENHKMKTKKKRKKKKNRKMKKYWGCMLALNGSDMSGILANCLERKKRPKSNESKVQIKKVLFQRQVLGRTNAYVN